MGKLTQRGRVAASGHGVGKPASATGKRASTAKAGKAGKATATSPSETAAAKAPPRPAERAVKKPAPAPTRTLVATSAIPKTSKAKTVEPPRPAAAKLGLAAARPTSRAGQSSNASPQASAPLVSDPIQNSRPPQSGRNGHARNGRARNGHARNDQTNGEASTGKSNGKGGAGTVRDSRTSSIVVTEGYRPTDEEPFMSERQRHYFRAKLTAWRDEIIRQTRETLQGLHEESLQYADIADRATSETDRSLELRARDRQRKLIGKIEQAIFRIDDGSYGYCEETGEPISLKRLDARPIATLSIEAQERHERRERVFRED